MIDWNLANTRCVLTTDRDLIVVATHEGNMRQTTYMSVMSSGIVQMGRGYLSDLERIYSSRDEGRPANFIICLYHNRPDLIKSFEDASNSYKPRINTYFPELEASQYPTWKETLWMEADKLYPIGQIPKPLRNKLTLNQIPPDPFQTSVSYDDHWEGRRSAGVDMPAAVHPGGRVAEVGRVERDREAEARNVFDEVVARLPEI